MRRQFNPAMFIRETLAPLLAKRMVSSHRPVLGIDEGLNNMQHVEPMVCRLVSGGVVSMATPLWYQWRIKSDGTPMNILGGGASESPLVPDIGRPRRGTSWPDEGVVAQLIAYFLTNDQLCLLSQNTKNDSAGLRRILQTEVAPVLEELEPKQLGLLVLVQRPESQLKQYCASVEHWLETKIIEPGFRWEFVPE